MKKTVVLVVMFLTSLVAAQKVSDYPEVLTVAGAMTTPSGCLITVQDSQQQYVVEEPIELFHLHCKLYKPGTVMRGKFHRFTGLVYMVPCDTTATNCLMIGGKFQATRYKLLRQIMFTVMLKPIESSIPGFDQNLIPLLCTPDVVM